MRGGPLHFVNQAEGQGGSQERWQDEEVYKRPGGFRSCYQMRAESSTISFDGQGLVQQASVTI